MGTYDKINLAKTVEPTWLKEVSPDSYMNLKDLADIFNVKTGTFAGKIVNGEFPKPDKKLISGHIFGKIELRTHKGLWKISTVRKFFKQAKE